MVYGFTPLHAQGAYFRQYTIILPHPMYCRQVLKDFREQTVTLERKISNS